MKLGGLSGFYCYYKKTNFDYGVYVNLLEFDINYLKSDVNKLLHSAIRLGIYAQFCMRDAFKQVRISSRKNRQVQILCWKLFENF